MNKVVEFLKMFIPGYYLRKHKEILDRTLASELEMKKTERLHKVYDQLKMGEEFLIVEIGTTENLTKTIEKVKFNGNRVVMTGFLPVSWDEENNTRFAQIYDHQKPEYFVPYFTITSFECFTMGKFESEDEARKIAYKVSEILKKHSDEFVFSKWSSSAYEEITDLSRPPIGVFDDHLFKDFHYWVRGYYEKYSQDESRRI